MLVAGLVLGIVALALSFIPCIGLIALIPAIVAVPLGAVGFAQSRKSGQGKGMGLASLVIGIAAVAWVPLYHFVVLPAMVVKEIKDIIGSIPPPSSQWKSQEKAPWRPDVTSPKEGLPDSSGSAKVSVTPAVGHEPREALSKKEQKEIDEFVRFLTRNTWRDERAYEQGGVVGTSFAVEDGILKGEWSFLAPPGQQSNFTGKYFTGKSTMVGRITHNGTQPVGAGSVSGIWRGTRYSGTFELRRNSRGGIFLVQTTDRPYPVDLVPESQEKAPWRPDVTSPKEGLPDSSGSAKVSVTPASQPVTIGPGDAIKVTGGPAPVKVGATTLATVEAGTQLTAIEVKDGWVKVTLEKAGEKITGWIHTRYLSIVAPGAGELALSSRLARWQYRTDHHSLMEFELDGDRITGGRFINLGSQDAVKILGGRVDHDKATFGSEYAWQFTITVSERGDLMGTSMKGNVRSEFRLYPLRERKTGS